MGTYDTFGNDRIVPDPVSTQISIAYEQENQAFIGGILAPTVRIGQQTGKYRIFRRTAFADNYSGDVRAPGTRANEIEGAREYEERTFSVIEHALEMPIPDEERENNPDENPDADAVEQLTGKLLLGKELAVRDKVYDDTQYRASHVVTLGAGEHLDEYATSDPIALFRDAFRTFNDSTGTIPNVGVIPWQAMSFLEDHPLIIERYQAQGGVINAEQIAQVLGLSRIVVPGAPYNAEDNPGLTATIQQIWGDNIVLAYVPGRPALKTPALMYELLWPISRGRRGPDNTTLDRRRDDDNIADIHRARRRYDVQLVGRDPDLPGEPVIAGFLIKDALASV